MTMALRHFSISSFSLNRFQPLNIYHLAYFYNFRFEYHDSRSYFQFPFDSFSFLHRIEKKIKRKNSVRIFYGSPMTRMAREREQCDPSCTRKYVFRKTMAMADCTKDRRILVGQEDGVRSSSR